VTDDGGATWDSAIVSVNLNGDKVAVYAEKRFRGLKDELDDSKKAIRQSARVEIGGVRGERLRPGTVACV